MANGRMTDEEIECALAGTLTRRHGWGGFVPEDDLVRFAVSSSEVGRARDVCEGRFRKRSFIIYQRGRGYRIDKSNQETLGEFLMDRCGWSEFRVRSSISRYPGDD